MAAETIALAGALTGARETLLVTLLCKAMDSALPRSVLHDRFAAEAVRRIDYDFARLRVTRGVAVGVAMRAKVLDDMVRRFLRETPDATVLNLGCGLDARVYRIDPPAAVRWLDVDFPDVIALRRRLYPAREGLTMLPASVTDPGWVATVPADRPGLVVAEGLLPYLAPEEIPALFRRLVARLPSGEIVFDGYSRLGLWLIRNNPAIRATGADPRGATEDPHALERAVPGLRLVAEGPAYADADGRTMPPAARLAMRAMLAIPALRRMGRLLVYAFGPPADARKPA
jgi:O-methyltransferase involved in polyketide biosynthesis